MIKAQALIAQKDALTAQKTSMQESLNSMTMGLGYEAYSAQVFSGLASQNIKSEDDLKNAINSLNNALVEIEKGQMTAAVEFANGKATITLGEYQLELAESQLEAGEEQIKSGVYEDLIRISVGIEDIEDLKQDFKNAIEGEK